MKQDRGKKRSEERQGDWRTLEEDRSLDGRRATRNRCLSLTQDWDLLCGFFVSLVEHKGSNAGVSPHLWNLKLIQLREVLLEEKSKSPELR